MKYKIDFNARTKPSTIINVKWKLYCDALCSYLAPLSFHGWEKKMKGMSGADKEQPAVWSVCEHGRTSLDKR